MAAAAFKDKNFMTWHKSLQRCASISNTLIRQKYKLMHGMANERERPTQIQIRIQRQKVPKHPGDKQK